MELKEKTDRKTKGGRQPHVLMSASETYRATKRYMYSTRTTLKTQVLRKSGTAVIAGYST